MSLLTMKNISKSFFGKTVLADVNLTVEPGEIHALLGENGAGKTTLMNILYGLYERDGGEVIYKEKPVVFTNPKDALEQGIGMVHQHFALVPKLTVAENVTLGLKSQNHPFPNRKALSAKVKEISEKYGLIVDPDARVSSLSVGEQQRVEIIKLLYRNAELLIMDEPTAVLTPQEIESFFQVLDKLKADGRSVIIITHRIPEVMRVTDRVTILRDGREIDAMNTKEIDAAKLSDCMIGRQLKARKQEHIVNSKNPAEGLKLSHIMLERAGVKQLDDISFTIRPGEILGIAGVDGNGQKELAETITGIRSLVKGQITLDGIAIGSMKVKERKEKGIGYISDDRHHDGLILDMNLTENMLLKNRRDPAYLKKGLLNMKKIKQLTQQAVTDYGVKTPSLEVPIRYLSGGNQQKLILARELAGDPKVIVAFQPTRGLDISATEFIQDQLLERKKQGCRILLISADLDEIVTLSDRIAVIYKGKIMDILPNTEAVDMNQIGLLMAGKKEEAR